MSDQTAYQSSAKGEILEGDAKNVAMEASATNQQYQPLQTPYSSFPPYQWDPSGQQYPPYQHFPLPQDLYYQAPLFKGDSQPTLMVGPYQQTIIKEEPSQETRVLKCPSNQTIAKDEPSEETSATKVPYQQTAVKEEPNQDPYNQTHLKFDPSHGIPNISNYYNFQSPHFYPPVNYHSVPNSNTSSQDTINTSPFNLSNDPNNTSEINSSSDTSYNSSMNSSRTSITRDSFGDASYSNTRDISSRNSSSGYDSAGDLDTSGNNQNGNNVSPNNAGRNDAVDSNEAGLEKSDWKEDISSVPPGWKIQKIFSSGNHVKTMVMSPEGKTFPSRKDAFIYMETHLKQPRKSSELPKRKDDQKKSSDNNLQPLTKKIKTNPPKEAFEKLEYTVTYQSDLERRNKNSGLDSEMLSKMKARGQQPAVIWDYFTKIEGSTDARCLYCNVSVIRPLATTSNMMGHLKTYHKDLYPTYEIHQKEAREKKKYTFSTKHVQEQTENMTEKKLSMIGDMEGSKGVPFVGNETNNKTYPEQVNSDNDKKSLPFKIPSSIEISLVKESTKVETTEIKKMEQSVLKNDPIHIMENDPYGPKISIKLNSFEKACSVFLTNPNPPPSVIFGISDNIKMPMEDVKWMFIKLRKIFQYKGKSVDEVALRRLVSHVNFTHQHATYFEF